jgi:hypothetical protein
MHNPPPHVFEEDDDDDELPEDSLSHISITIKAHVTIIGNNNALSVDPAMTGSKIAVAIVSGLRQMSGIAGGVPMIDENGRPRPIIVDVDAGTKIQGSYNIIGEKAVYATVPPPTPKIGTAQKRERAESEPVEDDDNSKRAKTE